jgi:hypothetical protein
VAEALRRANTLHMQRVGHPAVLQTRFAPTGSIGGSTAFSWEGHLHSLDLLPSPGLVPPGQESSSVEPKVVDPLQSKFLPGQATESVLKVTKRPKLRAKDVAHRQSLAAADVPVNVGAPRYWNLDHSFGSTGGHADQPVVAPASYFHTPQALPTTTATTVADTARIGLERSPVNDLPRR